MGAVIQLAGRGTTPRPAPRPTWLGASIALSRPVTVDEPYPHICGIQITGTMTGRPTRISGLWQDRSGVTRGDCAACFEKRQVTS